MPPKNPTLKKNGAILLCLLIGLTFFSNTAYSFNQPIVTAVLPKNGKLNKTEKTTGIADWAEKKDIYSSLTATVEEILVKEGESVQAGQPLFRMAYDPDAINGKLKENEIAKKKALLDIETTGLNIEKTNESIRLLNEENYTADPVSRYDIEECQREIEKSKKALADMEILYEAGAEPKEKVISAQYDLETWEKKLDKLNSQYEESVKKNQESLTDQEENRAKQLRGYQQDIKDYNQQLKSRKLDYESLLLQEESYKNELAEFESHTVIKAPADGTIYEIPIKEGQYIQEHTLMASMGMGNDFVIETVISKDNNFVASGDLCTISNTAVKMEAQVSKITPDENGKNIRLTLTSDKISAGESFHIEFEKESAATYTLVPNGALNMDKDGYFIYRISRRDGIMGKEYFATKVRVSIGDHDNQNTVITQGIDFFEPIASISNKPFSEKQALKLENESDFFEE